MKGKGHWKKQYLGSQNGYDTIWYFVDFGTKPAGKDSNLPVLKVFSWLVNVLYHRKINFTL